MSDLALTAGEPPRSRWFAVAAPGLEELVAREVRALPGAAAVQVVAGGVELEGDLAVGMRANLGLRVATRVLLRVATVRAREFRELRRRLARLPWERWVPAGDALRVQASASKSRLYHTGALAEALAGAVGDRLSARGHRAPELATRRRNGDPDDNDDDGDDHAGQPPAETRIFLRGVADEWMVSVDSSGALLHRRGWRTEGGRAPLRETVAAAMLQLAGYDPTCPLLDPMCGSGTIVLEAASLATGRPPGLGRQFAFQRWPAFDPVSWQALLAARPAPARPPAPIFAWDGDEQAVARARRNGQRAGLGEQIDFASAIFGAGAAGIEPAEALAALVARSGGQPGLVLINPPYGRRLGNRTAAARLVKDIGRTLRARFAGWRVGILLADARWAPALGLPTSARTVLPSGGLRLTLALAQVPAGPGRSPAAAGR